MRMITATGRRQAGRLQAGRRQAGRSQAAGSQAAGRLAGTPAAGLRSPVRAEFTGISTCTHLNDTLRALSDVGALIGALEAQPET